MIHDALTCLRSRARCQVRKSQPMIHVFLRIRFLILSKISQNSLPGADATSPVAKIHSGDS